MLEKVRRRVAVPRWLRDAPAAGTLVVVLVLWTATLAVFALTVPTSASCLPWEYEAAKRSGAIQAMSTAAPSSTTLEVADAKETQIVLGRANAPARTQVALKTDVMAADVEINAPIGVRVQSFRKGDGGDVAQAVLAWATFTSRHTAELSLCIERQGPGDGVRYGFFLEPGRFTGSAAVLDDRLPATTIPFTLDLAYPDPYGPLIPLGFVVAAGALYLMVLRRTDADADVGWKDLDKFLRKPSGLAPVVAGSAAAVWVYVGSYLTNDTWGSSGGDVVVLTGAMFTAFVSAGTAFRFVSNLGQPGGSAPPASAPSGPTPAGPTGAVPVTPTSSGL